MGFGGVLCDLVAICVNSPCVARWCYKNCASCLPKMESEYGEGGMQMACQFEDKNEDAGVGSIIVPIDPP